MFHTYHVNLAYLFGSCAQNKENTMSDIDHYAEVNSEIVADRLKNQLDDFEEFIDYIEKYLEN